MKHLDEYRDPALAQELIRAIEECSTRRRVLMEVCGGQTHSLLKTWHRRTTGRLLSNSFTDRVVQFASHLPHAIDLAQSLAMEQRRYAGKFWRYASCSRINSQKPAHSASGRGQREDRLLTGRRGQVGAEPTEIKRLCFSPSDLRRQRLQRHWLCSRRTRWGSGILACW